MAMVEEEDDDGEDEAVLALNIYIHSAFAYIVPLFLYFVVWQ